MQPTDAPAPFAEAYDRLQAAQNDTSFETDQHRKALLAADDRRATRANINRRLPKAY